MSLIRAATDRCLVYGHRGAPRERPENALASFERAVELGADGVELDVRATADGELIVWHDPDLRRLGVDADVYDLSLEEIRNVDAGAAFEGPKGDFPYRDSGLVLPTLAEVLDAARGGGYGLDIEVKNLPHEPDFTATPEVAIDAAALVLERDMVADVVFSSFNLSDMSTLKRLHPELRVAWLTVPDFSAVEALALVRQEHLDGLHPGYGALDGAVVDEVVHAAHAGERPIWIAPWTVNDVPEIEHLVRAGVDGVITDIPGKAARVVAG